jgi:hypothetical protein
MRATLSQLTHPVALWVLRDNVRARRFYERAGFIADGTEKAADLVGHQLREVRYVLSGATSDVEQRSDRSDPS